MFPVHELADDVRRVTFPLPTPPGHAHGYLLRADDGWTLVDAGLGVPGAEDAIRALAGSLDAPVVRIVITHMHPDHVGGAEPAAAATGAAVWQGALDHEQCERVWGDPNWPRRVADWLTAHGTPDEFTRDLVEHGRRYASVIRFARKVRPLREGDSVGGWRVVEVPGHADGHIALLRDGRLVAGDHLLPGISPAVGLYPESRPDPLGTYLRSLRRTLDLGPRSRTRDTATRSRNPPPARTSHSRTTTSGCRRPSGRSPTARRPGTRSRSRSSPTRSSRAHAGSPSRRRSRTSSAWSRSGRPGGAVTAGSSPILRRDDGGRRPAAQYGRPARRGADSSREL